MAKLPGAVSEMTDEQMDESLGGVDESASPLRASIFNSQNANRELAGRASVVGREMGVPTDMAERNIEALERERSLEAFDFDALEQNHPILSDYLSDANNAKLFSDEVGFWTRTGDYLGSFAGQGVGRTVGSGLSGTGYYAQQADRKLAEFTGATGLPMDTNTALLRTYLKLFSDVAQPLGGAIEKGGEYIEPPEERKNFGTEVVGGVGQAGGNIILSLIPGAGPAAMFGQGVEQQKDRMDAEGVPEDERSFVALTAGGAATAATEMIEAKFLLGGLKKIPGVSNSQILKSANSLAAKLPGPLKSKWAGRLASLGGAAGAEAGQEVLEGFLQDLIEYTAYNPDVDWFKDWEQEASVAGASGLITKGIVMGVTSIGRSSAHVRGDGEKKDKVSAEIQAMRAVAQQARQGQSVKRDPVKFQELMTALNQNGQEVYVTPETALALEQSGVDFTDLLRISPDIGAKLNEALATGADVAVPVDRVIGLAAQTDQYDAIFDHIRTAPDGPTLAEAQRTVTDEDAANERIRDILDEERARIDEQDLDRAGREDYEQVQERIYSQLVNTGRETAATARTQAELIGRIYETLASRTDSAPLAQRLRSRFENVETFGPRPAFRYRPDEFDVLIDQAKTRARQLQSRKDRKEGSENTNKNLFGEANKKVRKGKAAPTPVINWLAQRGGILRGSPIAKELESMDITPANYPRLFRSKSKGGVYRTGGKNDLDAIPANEFNADFADRGVVATEDGNGYVDIAWLLEQISNESFGKGVDTYENQERQAQIDYLDQLLDILDRQGVDITSARNADIKAALGQFARENTAQAMAYNQDNIPKNIENLQESLVDDFGIETSMYEQDGNRLFLSKIEVDKDKRGQGLGTRAMERIAAYADSKGMQIVLSPSVDFGASSVARLKRFYKRFGFVENKGRNKDFTTQESMIRQPRGVMPFYQSAYHGTPHKFDKFTLDHIGSGEGVQAYGWGLYFAGRKEIAEYYRETLTESKKSGFLGEKAFDWNTLKTATARLGRTPEKTIKFLEQDLQNTKDPGKIADIKADIKTLKKVKKDPGQLFEVDIPGDEVLLDWDKTFNEQPKLVREALEKAGISAPKAAPAITNPTVARVVRAALKLNEGNPRDIGLVVDNDQSLYNSALSEMKKRGLDTEDVRPGDFIESEAKEHLTALQAQADFTGEKIYNEIAKKHAYAEPEPSWTSAGRDTEETPWSGHKGASLELKDLGIKGIKYLDGGSRGDGDGTFNYVIFDDEAIRVLNTFYQDEQGSAGPRGSTVFLEDGNGNVRTLIQLFETSNRSTFLHESGHFFLDLMQDVFTDPAAPAQMKADWQATLDWFKQNGKAIHKEALGQRAFAVQHDADSGKYYTLGWDGSRVEHGTRAEAQAMADEKNTQAREALEAKSEDGDVAVAKFVDGGYKPTDAADYLLYRATHEQFARGFEAYLFKGEAPSVETRSIFETFRAWLERVYRYAIENLRVNVSPEMKGVFDRMIATDEQIEEARANMPIFRPDPSTLEMLNEQQKADYLKINERAAMSARNKLFRKAMRQHERKQTQWYKEERAKVRAEQEAILNESPLWRAVEFFKTGKGPDGTVIMESGFKLDRKAISKEFGAEVVKYLPKGVTNAKASGLDPAVAAEMFGYKNAAEMIRAMTGLDTRKNTIERWTDEEMVKRHGDMLIDGTMEREALEALMAENPAAQAFELKALSAKTGVEYPADGDFKRAAAELLGGKKVDDAIKPEQYLRAAIKARGQYAKMLERKDYDAAAVAKRQEILNRHAYKQAVEARENVQKALDHFSELARKPKKQKKLPFDADYRDKILELLSSVNLAPRISAGRRLKLELAAINEWIREKQENDSAQLMMPPELEAADGLTHYREMTLEEFIAFRDLVYNIEKQGRKKMELIVEGKRRQLAEDAEAAAEIIYKNNDVIEQPIDPQRARDQNLKERGKALVNSLVNISRKAETLIEKLDGGKTKGFIWDRLRGGIFEGELKEQVMRREASQKLNEITFKHYGKMTVELPGGRKYDAAAEDLTSTKTRVWINAHVGYMTREQIIMAVLNMGNRDNKEKLRDGRKGRDGQAWTDEDIEAIKRAVRAKDAAFINDIWEFLDSYWPQIYTLQRERLGYAPEKIEAEPFELVTADGQNVAMRGGYFRMKYDGMLSARVAETDVTGMAKELMMGTLSGTQTRRGHTHERKAGVTRPVKLHLSVINMHVNEVIHDLALGEATYNAMKFLRHPKMMEAITDTQGVEGFEALEMWLMDTAAGGLSASSDMDRLQAGMRHTLTMGSLALKYTTIAVQLTGFANTVVEIRPRWAMAGLARYMQLGGPLGAGSRVAEISEYMKQRPLLINRDVAASIRKLEKGGAWSDAQTAALAPMLRMQYVVDTVTWLGAYERAQAEGLKEKEAIRYADLAVDRAQGSSFISSLSAPERGTTGKMSRLQEANKTWTIFMSYFNAKLNVAMRRTEAFKKAGGIKNPAALASLGVDYMTLFWVEYALGELILGRVPDFEDEDDPFWSFMKWVFAGAATTAASGVIFLRDAAGVLQGFNAQPASARGLQSIGQAVGQIGREGANIISGEDEVNWYKAAKAGVTLGNFMSPVKYPSGQMNTLLEAMEDSSQGKDVSPLDYLRYNPNK